MGVPKSPNRLTLVTFMPCALAQGLVTMRQHWMGQRPPLPVVIRQRPYRVENTGSLPNSAVKQRRARLVLGWGTACESLGVLLSFFCFFCFFLFLFLFIFLGVTMHQLRG